MDACAGAQSSLIGSRAARLELAGVRRGHPVAAAAALAHAGRSGPRVAGQCGSDEGVAVEPVQPVVLHEDEVTRVDWDDPVRGRVGFRTLFSAGTTPTAELTTGVTVLEEGGWLGAHRHRPAEVYSVLAGEGVVVLDGVEHRVRAGSAVYVPGDAEHSVRNTGRAALRFLYVFATDAFEDVEYRFSAD